MDILENIDFSSIPNYLNDFNDSSTVSVDYPLIDFDDLETIEEEKIYTEEELQFLEDISTLAENSDSSTELETLISIDDKLDTVNENLTTINTFIVFIFVWLILWFSYKIFKSMLNNFLRW